MNSDLAFSRAFSRAALIARSPFAAAAALIEWGHATFGKDGFIYPLAVQNTASRRIAEKLHGVIIGSRKNTKYDSVVYRIPFSV